MKNLIIYYLRSSDPFEEIEAFVKSCETHYEVKIIEIQVGTSMLDVLTKICDNDKKIRACIMGSRRSDPWCDRLQYFQVFRSTIYISRQIFYFLLIPEN